MSQYLGRIRALLALMAPLYLLIACSNSAENVEQATQSALVQPYASATPEIIELSEPSATESSVEQDEPLSSISYVIVAGDTLLGIAERNGLSLDELLLANPGIDARFLSIGQELSIPLGNSSLP